MSITSILDTLVSTVMNLSGECQLVLNINKAFTLVSLDIYDTCRTRAKEVLLPVKVVQGRNRVKTNSIQMTRATTAVKLLPTSVGFLGYSSHSRDRDNGYIHGLGLENDAGRQSRSQPRPATSRSTYSPSRHFCPHPRPIVAGLSLSQISPTVSAKAYLSRKDTV